MRCGFARIAALAVLGLRALLWCQQLPPAFGKKEAAGSCASDSPRCAARCPERVLVVGAGLAGLVAAQTLQRAGCEVLVLEAHGHVGGRAAAIQTGPFEGFDAGAQWIHGGAKNLPMMALARFFNLTLEYVGGNTDFEGRYDRHRLIHLQRANDSLKAEAFLRYAKAKALFERRVAWSMWNEDQSLRFAWELVVNQSSAAEDLLLEWQLRVRSEQNWGVSADEVGTRLAEMASYSVFYSEEEDMLMPADQMEAGDGDAQLVGGFSALVRELAKGLDVHFNVPVTSISLEDLVLVRTEDATYRGAAVIVTVPLAVLQQKLRFQGPLPEDFNASINRLQMGDVAKLFIRFKHAQSPIGRDTYLLSQLASHKSRSLLYYCIRGETGRASALPSTTLTCLLSGPSFGEALRLKQTGQEALLSHITEELLQMYPQLQPSAVEAVQLESFSWDPFVLGSWTSGKVGSSSQDFDVFDPLPGLAFAGEHTCRLMYGTAQAAAVSGARAAHQVLAGEGDLSSTDDWPFFKKELYSLCDEVAQPFKAEHCGFSCSQLWALLAESVPSLFQRWRGMARAARRRWSRLGWVELSWMRQARKPTSSNKLWLRLSSAERHAAAGLGFAEESWNEAAKITADIALCRLEGSDYFQLWDCLTDGQRRDWQRLGLNRAMLNGEIPSALAKTSWSQLTPTQIPAAIRIGYRSWMW